MRADKCPPPPGALIPRGVARKGWGSIVPVASYLKSIAGEDSKEVFTPAVAGDVSKEVFTGLFPGLLRYVAPTRRGVG